MAELVTADKVWFMWKKKVLRRIMISHTLITATYTALLWGSKAQHGLRYAQSLTTWDFIFAAWLAFATSFAYSK